MEAPAGLQRFQPQIHSSRMFLYRPSADTQQQERVFSFSLSWKSGSREFGWQVHKTRTEVGALHRDVSEALRRSNRPPVTPLVSDEAFSRLESNDQRNSMVSYLQGLSSREDVCESVSFLVFCEASALSFTGSSGKRKEGYVWKRTGGRVANETRVCNCSRYFRRFQKRWLVIRDTMIGYMTDNLSPVLLESLLFKGRFRVVVGLGDTGYPDGIRVETSQRSLLFRTGSEMQMWQWQEAIQQAYSESEWSVASNPNFSSFPVRTNCEATWYIDGSDYFAAVYEALVGAKREVFISDWWLSPELYLKRPPSDSPETQLVEVLGKLADSGVSICVCVYKEVKFTLGLNSLHTKRTLKKRSPNIRVMRHPCRSVTGGEFLWTHHEKTLVVDQEVAFLGGLDLSFGRWDTPSHVLFDSDEKPVWPGKDYYNCFVCDFIGVEEFDKDSVDRHRVPRMPWHDVGVRVKGKIAGDVALHFIELWNHEMTDITGTYYRKKTLLQPSSFSNHFTPLPEKQPCDSFEVEPDNEWGASLYPHRQAIHRRVITASGKRINIETLRQRVQTSSLDGGGSPLSKSSVRMEFASFRSARASLGPHTETSPILHPGRDTHDSPVRLKTQAEEDEHELLEAVEELHEREAILGHNKELSSGQLLVLEDKGRELAGTCECQLVRSGGPWSLGLEEVEFSVHTAYLNLIDQADFFVYIENQFFISSTAGPPVVNQIAQALVERIKVSAAHHEPFKVIVALPLLPAFEGSIDDPAAAVLRIELHWEYQTISRGVRSMIAQLETDPNVKDPMEYIRFYGLRTHGVTGTGVPTTELVYIHSKMIIVDDSVALIGSANINDRSMLGCNDSEVAILVRDSKKISSRLGGAPANVSEWVYRLRMQVFQEHSGCKDEEILRDPLDPVFATAWEDVARRNTEFYRDVFHCYPDDRYLTIADIGKEQGPARPYDPSAPTGHLVGVYLV